MRIRTDLKVVWSVIAVVAGGVYLAGSSAQMNAVAQVALPPQRAVMPVTPASLLEQVIPDSTPNASVLRQGQYLVAAGDCMSCHLRGGGEPLAGGLGLTTPFGTIYSSNITSDRETGIGAWTNETFYRAMHEGIGARGENLYPAFPYPWFRRLSRADTDAILAYLKTTLAVKYTPPANELHFPLNIRATVKGWNLLYLKGEEYQADPAQSPQWNRGAYLVNGPGHCSGCHTPKGRLGADLAEQSFYGGTLDNWVAPDLTPNAHSGLGTWSLEDVSEYLKTGRNSHAGAAGPMADVVTYSTSLLSDADRHAIAIYLRSLSPSPVPSNVAISATTRSRGEAIFSDACASCHLENGVGQPRYFPPLGRNAIVQQADATGLEHLILAGGRIASTASRPSPLAMPSFAWKLSDQEIADVATYVRNAWGNQASAISVTEVTQLRGRLGLVARRPTVNSGDWQ